MPIRCTMFPISFLTEFSAEARLAVKPVSMRLGLYKNSDRIDLATKIDFGIDAATAHPDPYYGFRLLRCRARSLQSGVRG